jgi:hypothetical protein
MKPPKILDLAAIAAMAFIAFASSASADVLCKAAPNKSGECSTAAGDYAAGTKFTAEAKNPKLTVVSGATSSVTCEKSNTTLENTSTGSNTPGEGSTWQITELSFTGNCQTAGGTSCTISETSGYTGTLTATNNKGAGTFHVTGSSIKTKVVCGGIFSCEYSPFASGLSLTFTGGNPATVTANGAKLDQVSGFGCGTEALWDATYTATGANSAVWVATKMD